MHAAAGLGAAVAAMELAPRASERIDVWLLALGIMVGASLSVGLAWLTSYVRKKLMEGAGRTTTWGAYAAVGIDLMSDGLMVGSGAAISSGLGILLALSQVIGNLPAGFAITASFRSADVRRAKRLGALALYPAVPLLGALLGYFLLRGAGEMLTGTALAVFAGLLLTATIEDIVPEADAPGAPRRISSPFFAGGFVLLMLMSDYLGG